MESPWNELAKYVGKVLAKRWLREEGQSRSAEIASTDQADANKLASLQRAQKRQSSCRNDLSK